MTLIERIWSVNWDVDHYPYLIHDSSVNLEIISKFAQSKSLVSSWTPIQVSLVIEAQHITKVDFPYLSGAILVMSQRASSILIPFITHQTEVLPLECRDGEFYAINHQQ